jgi:hypothetical protein
MAQFGDLVEEGPSNSLGITPTWVLVGSVLTGKPTKGVTEVVDCAVGS